MAHWTDPQRPRFPPAGRSPEIRRPDQLLPRDDRRSARPSLDECVQLRQAHYIDVGGQQQQEAGVRGEQGPARARADTMAWPRSTRRAAGPVVRASTTPAARAVAASSGSTTTAAKSMSAPRNHRPAGGGAGPREGVGRGRHGEGHAFGGGGATQGAHVLGRPGGQRSDGVRGEDESGHAVAACNPRTWRAHASTCGAGGG
jgi:hypothetical protein